jgi:hypothetical protein
MCYGFLELIQTAKADFTPERQRIEAWCAENKRSVKIVGMTQTSCGTYSSLFAAIRTTTSCDTKAGFVRRHTKIKEQHLEE